MAITVNIYYKGENGSAQKFVNEMIDLGIVEDIRSREGNKRYEYFSSIDNPETILLIDSWENQEALDEHHLSNIMPKIMELREKYNIKIQVERYILDNESITETDKQYIDQK